MRCVRLMSAAPTRYNTRVKGSIRKLIGLLAVFWTAALGSAYAGPIQTSAPDAFWEGLSRAFASGDLSGYAEAFVPRLRDKERLRAEDLRKTFGMTSVLFRVAGRSADPDGTERIFLQVFFQNELSAMLENWQVVPVSSGGAWLIAEKTVSGGLGVLYKLRLPSGRALRAGRVEVSHQDFKLTFTEAFVFHDNLPDLETGLIVLGEGRLRFTPSHAAERHQLELRYGTPYLEDKIESAYLRFSPGYFQSHVRIESERPIELSAEKAEALAAKAAAIFRDRYGASFTVENSLTGEPMTFLPRDEQAVFDLQARRAGALTYVYSPYAEDEIHLASRRPDRIISLYTPDSEGPPLRRMYLSFDRRADIRNCTIDVDVQPDRKYLSGRARLEFKAQVDDVDSLRFNLHPALDILRIQDQGGRSLFFTQDKTRGLLYVFLLDALPKGGEAWIEVLYRGVLNPPAPTADDLTAGQAGGAAAMGGPAYETLLYSQSAYWYPSPPEDDFFQASLRVVVPPGYTCVASGLETEKGIVDNLGRVTALEKVGHPYFGFRSREPLRYLSFLVGRLTPIGGDPGPDSGPPVEAFYASDVRLPSTSLPQDSRDILRVFGELFGPYPFAKLTVVQRQWPTGGGHSPASLVVLNDLPRASDGTRLLAANAPVNLGRFRIGYLAHEIAHQWWGQGVSWATYKDQWLSEGLSQFSAALYLRGRQGEDAYRSLMQHFARWTARKSRLGPIILGTRLRHLDFSAYQAIVYDKSALVMGMLLDLVGEERFFRGLRDFFARNRGQAARTRDFIQVMSAAAERDLKPFFDRWLGSHLLPEIRASHSVQTVAGRPVLRVQVTQTGPAFVFPLWIAWTEDGRKVRRSLDMDAASKTFDIPCAGHPSRVRFDPDGIFPGSIR